MFSDILIRSFVKNYENTESLTVCSAYGRLAGVVGIICNALLFALKLAVGLLAGSISILADAMNNLSDTTSSIVTLISFKIAKKPADKNHPFGHARMEYVSGFVIAVFIVVMGYELGKSSLKKIISPEPVSISLVTLGVLAAAIAVKLWMSFFYSKVARAIDSTTVYAASKDSRNDVLTTAAALTGALLNFFFAFNIDGWLGMALSIFIVYSGIALAKETLDPILGSAPNREYMLKVMTRINQYESVLGVHDLMIHDYGMGQKFASVHIEMDINHEPGYCHEIIDKIEQDFLERDNLQLVVHYDPVSLDDKEQSEAREMVREFAESLGEGLDIHDFRLIRGRQRSELVFDLVIPHDLKERERELVVAMKMFVKSLNPRYVPVITIDSDSFNL